MVDLHPKYLKEVQKILKEEVPQYDVWAFGSRVKGHAKTFSDLDLAVMAKKPLDWKVCERLKEIFSASDLPIKVDVVDGVNLSLEFQKHIYEDGEMIQKGEFCA